MVKVFFDNNMPPSIARALHELVAIDGHTAVPLRDKFPKNVSDIDYFSELGREGNWVVISKDLANAKRPPERAAILASGVIALYLAKSVQRQSINEQAATILWQWDKIVVQRKNNENGMFTPVRARYSSRITCTGTPRASAQSISLPRCFESCRSSAWVWPIWQAFAPSPDASRA